MVSHLVVFVFLGLVQIALALLGGYVSVKSLPAHEKRLPHIWGFLVLGGLGVILTVLIGVQSYTAEKESIKASKETADAQRKMGERVDAVGKHIDDLLIALTRKQPEDELTRRNHILSALRNEYILRHDNIRPAIMAGTEEPPADWVNKRLRELGEKWSIQVPTKAAAPAESKNNSTDTKPVDAEVQLAERAVEAVESCHLFEDSAIARMNGALARVQEHPNMTEQTRASYRQWIMTNNHNDEMKLYEQLYRQEFMEVRRLLALKVSYAVRPSNDYDDPGNLGGVTGVCSDLSDLTEAYLNREYRLGKITLEDGRQYLGRMRPLNRSH